MNSHRHLSCVLVLLEYNKHKSGVVSGTWRAICGERRINAIGKESGEVM
jgi:hypothetical protein